MLRENGSWLGSKVMGAVVTQYGLLDMQVCVPAGWTDGQIVEFANNAYPCGTSRGWRIRPEGDRYLQGMPERNPCVERHGFVHVMLDA